MSLLKYIPLQLVFFQIIGILIGYYLPFSPKIILLLLGVMICFLGIYLYRIRNRIVQHSYFFIIAFLTFISIGMASIILKDSRFQKNYYAHYLSKTENAAILKIDKILKSNTYYYRYYADVTFLNSQKTQGKVLLNIGKDSSEVQLNIDDHIYVVSSFNSVKKPLNPYQFNYKNYLAKQQIYHQVTVKNRHFLQLKSTKHTLKGWAAAIRKHITISLKNNGFKGDELAIINALLLGQRQDISNDILQNYQNAGAIHILAVSGLHIGILLLLLTFLLKPFEKLKYGKIIELVLIVFLLWGYAFIAGLSASIIRAVTMFTAISIVVVLNRTKNTYQALIISLFFLLLFRPYYLFDVGFQLSYSAVFFIVWIQPMLYQLWKPPLKIVAYFWQLFTVSIAAQLGVLPLSLFYFHQFPGLFFLSNLLIIPFLGVILAIGILIIVLSLLHLLPHFIAEIYQKIIFLLNIIVEQIGSQESFLFQYISFSVNAIFLYYFIVYPFFKWIETKKHYYLKLALVAIIGFQLNLLAEKYISTHHQEFIIFNKPKHTLIGIKKGKELQLYHDSIAIQKEYSIKAYLIGSRATLSSLQNNIKSLYNINTKKLLVIDSLGAYRVRKFSPDYILLRTSPKVNLERIIETLHPKMIIADGSNFKSYASRWKKTCKNYNIKFYYTVTDGAFVEKLY